jgi:hypothetical protein
MVEIDMVPRAISTYLRYKMPGMQATLRFRPITEGGPVRDQTGFWRTDFVFRS